VAACTEGRARPRRRSPGLALAGPTVAGLILAGPILAILAPGASGAAANPAEPPPLPRVGDAVLEPVVYARLQGWDRDGQAAALAVFRRTCAAPRARPVPSELPRGAPSQDLAAPCAAAAEIGPGDAAARAFFETWFDAWRVVRPGLAGEPARTEGFLTGYFEPEVEGSLEPGPGFAAPLLARPDDLVPLEAGDPRPPGLDPALRAARRGPDGALVPYPDRAAIEDGALGDRARPVAWLRDAVDVLVMQVQGSGRVRLPDGRTLRVAYDGRNGQPYSSVARLIVGEGHLPLENLTLARWTGWLRANPEAGRRLIRRNASYIFFRIDEALRPEDGPVGAAGVPMATGRGLAVDQSLWRYGLPVWLGGTLPTADGGAEPLGRLTVAQDTGSAILGPARGDLFLGSGEAAGVRAGLTRQAVAFVVLLPRRAPRQDR
jgi:membrane-bound lytic murein transglycosylase A